MNNISKEAHRVINKISALIKKCNAPLLSGSYQEKSATHSHWNYIADRILEVSQEVSDLRSNGDPEAEAIRDNLNGFYEALKYQIETLSGYSIIDFMSGYDPETYGDDDPYYVEQ